MPRLMTRNSKYVVAIRNSTNQSLSLICEKTSRPLPLSTINAWFSGILYISPGSSVIIEESRINIEQLSRMNGVSWQRAQDTTDIYFKWRLDHNDYVSECYHFQIQIATDESFSNIIIEHRSAIDNNNWLYFDGQNWRPLTAAGMSSSFTGQYYQYRLTIADAAMLRYDTTYHIRVRQTDGVEFSVWSPIQTFSRT